MNDVRQFSQQSQVATQALLSDAQDPHGELLAMIWGPRFDREHALGLWATMSTREPVRALPLLPDLMRLADRFDALAAPLQHRLRRVIMRHQSLQSAAM